MRKYQIILTFLFIIFYLSWLYFSDESFRKSKEAKITDINNSVIDIKKRVFIDLTKIYHSSYKLWGLEESSILKERIQNEKLKESDRKLSKVEDDSKVDILKRKICIDKNCWIFMGIIGMDDKIKVTLLSTDKKQKLETFTIGDELLKDLTIKKITEDEMVVVHNKNNKKFVLKLFDINVSKYFPQNIKETHE